MDEADEVGADYFDACAALAEDTLIPTTFNTGVTGVVAPRDPLSPQHALHCVAYCCCVALRCRPELHHVLRNLLKSCGSQHSPSSCARLHSMLMQWALMQE